MMKKVSSLVSWDDFFRYFCVKHFFLLHKNENDGDDDDGGCFGVRCVHEERKCENAKMGRDKLVSAVSFP